jgi:hypothetical protein
MSRRTSLYELMAARQACSPTLAVIAAGMVSTGEVTGGQESSPAAACCAPT